jgi:hypothetical protein
VYEFEWQIARGDSDFFEIEITDEQTSTPVDITGAVIYFTVKNSSNEPDSAALIYKEISEHIDAINGKTRFDLLSTDTNKPIGRYLYDLIIVFPTGDRKHLIPPSPFIITSSIKGI